jgi:F-type H+-transporting ATPase subunit gamma
MGNLRDIKRRMASVKNTTKITRTMELIATAKSQQCVNRIKKALPYFQALAEIAGQARQAGGDGSDAHPLLAQREIQNVAILVVVANRGLCGGYNGNALRMARDHRLKLQGEGKGVKLFASGKKGLGWLKFAKIPYEGEGFTQFEDKPAFTDVEMVGDQLINLFLKGEVDRVDVVYTHYYSAGRQAAVTETFLPITSAQEADETTRGKGEEAAPAKDAVANFIIEPDPKTILDALFPLQAKLHLYRVYLEAATSEQIARRIAMKNATDNGNEVTKALKMDYNRARQSKITSEILEVLGGAEAQK